MPPDVAAELRAIGPVIDVSAVAKLYTPLQASAPRDGVKRTADLKYGPDERNRLDVYEPAAHPAQPMPVLAFIQARK